MDIKWRKYSHSVIAKLIAAMIALVCFTSAITIILNILEFRKGNFEIVFEESYFLGNDHANNCSDLISSLNNLRRFKNEENILQGNTLSNDRILDEEERLFREFEFNSKSFKPHLNEEENYAIFKEAYADKITQMKNQLIKRELEDYNSVLRNLEQYQGVFYYTKQGEYEFTNSSTKTSEYFESFPAYLIFEGPKQKVFPEMMIKNPRYYWVTSNTYTLGQQDIMYLGFTEEFINPRITQWEEDKAAITKSLYQIAGYLSVLVIALIYLALVIGRTPQKDEGIQLNFIDRIYNDLKISMCFVLIASWFGVMVLLHDTKIYELIFPLTLVIAAIGLPLVLSLVKHVKNRTLIKHSLIFSLFYKLYNFFKEIYNSGSVGVKIVLIVIGYPLIVALTFFIFPITIGAAIWVAFRKAKEFMAIKEGVKKVKEGDLHHKVDISGKGEFAQLAADINSITDGLYKAVGNEIKSERLKTELITNVSHDIRTPLTSIITYVDLLKNEQDQKKVGEYLEIIDQKSQRLKVLTEDLFEAAKASSGNIPVTFEKIDVVSLITQGLGELDDKIQDRQLEFKISQPKDKVYIEADGKLLWRAIENLLSNIFKYALEGSRVYIEIIDFGTEVKLIIKNISAYALNISPDELMERFKRGDESRSSQGSGLGLSIAKSLIEIQKGSFRIEIDGDLFKAIIQMGKVEKIEESK